MCTRSAAKPLLHNTLLLPLNHAGVWQRTQHQRVHPATKQPIGKHEGDQRHSCKWSQTYPELQSHHSAIKGQTRLGRVCHRAGSAPPRTSLETFLSLDMVLGWFRCSPWSAVVFSGMLTMEESSQHVPGTSHHQQILLRSVSLGI